MGMSKENNFDVIIVGGGLSGLSLSCLLGRHNMRVACIDQLDPKQAPKDLRTTAISYGSKKILDRVPEIWPQLKTACPIEDIQIFDGSSPMLLQFLSEEAGGQSFGWIVDNHELKCALMACMKTMKAVKHFAPNSVKGYEIEADKASVHLETGEILSAQLIIGADGRGSLTRKDMSKEQGFETRGWDYHQRAVICNVRHENPHNNVAVEHFYPAGPFAVLPLADDENGVHRSSVVFTEHGPKRKSLMNLTDEEFEIALAERFPEWYGDIKMITKRAAFPLNLIHASEYIAPRRALVADAAHGIHPIAGQGLNLGFRDLGAIDEILQLAYEQGADLGAQDLLQRYQRARRFDNMSMIAVTDGLVRLFSNNIPPVRIARKIGLKAVSKFPPAKRFFMRQAMGDR